MMELLELLACTLLQLIILEQSLTAFPLPLELKACFGLSQIFRVSVVPDAKTRITRFPIHIAPFIR